jgi:UDP-glucose 4-epimerase
VVTALLISEGHKIIVLDNLSSGYSAAVDPGARLVRGDIADEKLVSDICKEGIDIVMHLAGLIQVGESTGNPSKYYQSNLAKSLKLLDTLRENGINKLVFSSSASVYGEPEKIPITEEANLHPVNPYGWTKMMLEQALRDYDRAYGFKSVALRYFNSGGAYRSLGEDHHPETHLIPIILEAALKHTAITINGTDYPTEDGSCIRDYVHVKDIANAHLQAALYLSQGGGTDCFNLGTGRGYSVLEVLRAAERVTGHQIKKNISSRRAGDSAVLVASRQKAGEILGWGKTLSSLEDIIQSAYQWKQQNPEGYRR